MDTKENTIKLDDLYTIKSLAEGNARVLTEQGIRWQLRHRYANGLDACCVRVGKRILISKPLYENWLATQTESRDGKEPA